MSIFENFKNIFKRKYPINVYYSGHEEDPHVVGLDARELYATQANLHAVVSFLADSVAQLPLKIYERKDETERIRNRESIAAKLLYKPNSDQTSYEFFNALVLEYLLFGEAIVLVLQDDSSSGYQLRVIPNEWIERREYLTNFAPSKLYIRATTDSKRIELDASNFVIFKMYNPGSPASYQSPIASLKQTLSEQIQANRFRTAIWRSSGRMNAYITRPANVTPWSPQARDAWTEAFRKGWSEGGQKAGSMPILEDGMDIKPFQFSAKEAQYTESVQLSREDVAAAYHVNPSLIWHTTTQTYASAKDNARALYADCLGPLLQMLQQRINSFLLPLVDENENLYVEFDLEEKLKGSFEERASIYQSAAGVPYLTVNEVRAELNRPPVDGGDERVIPMNVLLGGQMSPQDSSPTSYSNMYSSHTPHKKEVEDITKHGKIEIDAEASKEDIDTFQKVLEKFFKRQKASIATKLKAVEDWWDQDRWDKELADDLYPILLSVSDAIGQKIAAQLTSAYYSGNTQKYLRLLAETRAKYINQTTYDEISYGQEQDQSIDTIFDGRLLAAALIAEGLASTAEEFATQEAIEQAEYQGVIASPRVTKTWHTGDNPRESHAAMDGETVDYDDTFSNGLRWPHDYGPADEVAGCNCWCSVQIEY